MNFDNCIHSGTTAQNKIQPRAVQYYESHTHHLKIPSSHIRESKEKQEKLITIL